MPLITGQDPAGIVVKVGTNVDAFKKGDRVALSGRMAYGQCELCAAKRAGDCPNAKSIGMNRWQIKGAAGGRPHNVERALEFARTGKITCTMDRVLPLEALHEAYDMIGNGDVQGKIIIDPVA